MITFGPVTSRRLGMSLGINNIPSVKACTYACIYCQVGPTRRMTVKRQRFYEPTVLCEETKKHLASLAPGNKPDYLTLVSNGEPTLDSQLGDAIRLLKTLGYPVAVITNGSLVSMPDVQDDLKEADWVSLKMDAVRPDVWKAINRPHGSLNMDRLKASYLQFAAEYKGVLATETMLVAGFNDKEDVLDETAAFLSQLHPAQACLSIPIRPPVSSVAKVPSEEAVIMAYQRFQAHMKNVILLNQFEGTETGFTGRVIEDVVDMCTVHPIREDTLKALLEKEKADPAIIEMLVSSRVIKAVTYQNHLFYIRSFTS